jgi:hypothetical protein
LFAAYILQLFWKNTLLLKGSLLWAMKKVLARNVKMQVITYSKSNFYLLICIIILKLNIKVEFLNDYCALSVAINLFLLYFYHFLRKWVCGHSCLQESRVLKIFSWMCIQWLKTVILHLFKLQHKSISQSYAIIQKLVNQQWPRLFFYKEIIFHR